MPKNFLPFEAAREYVHSLKLEGRIGWLKYNKSGKRPPYIPSVPENIYKDKWISYEDWTGAAKWLPYEIARQYVISLGLKSSVEWRVYCVSGKKPKNIPSVPKEIYKDKWISYEDWLGFTTWLPYEIAHQYVLSLRLKGTPGWKAYCASGKRPENIPSNPQTVYKEFVSHGNWTGCSIKASKIRDFDSAREFMHTVGLKSWREWKEFANSSKKPINIPKYPYYSYKGKGWISRQDWIGTKPKEKIRSLNPKRAYKVFIPYQDFNLA